MAVDKLAAVNAASHLAREAATLDEILGRLAELPAEKAKKIEDRIRPAPPGPPPEHLSEPQRPPVYRSWAEFVRTEGELVILRWCAQKAAKSNKERLMPGPVDYRLTGPEVYEILVAAKGRCIYCGSLAVEHRPSSPEGHPVPWNRVGRRTGSLGHIAGRIHGGSNHPDNLVWSCLRCNTWQSERSPGATDHGGIQPRVHRPNQGNATKGVPIAAKEPLTRQRSGLSPVVGLVWNASTTPTAKWRPTRGEEGPGVRCGTRR